MQVQIGAAQASADGAKHAELRYEAYGQTRYAWGDTPTSFRFTGQREDDTIGLYFYNARYYDPMLGRFIQADTIVPNPSDPQDLNRYSYVKNNPLRYTDPSGHCVAGENGECDPRLTWEMLTHRSPEDYYWYLHSTGINWDGTDDIALFIAATLWDPADAVITTWNCLNGNCSAIDVASIMLPFVSSKTDDALGALGFLNRAGGDKLDDAMELADEAGEYSGKMYRSASGTPASLTPRPRIDDVSGGGLTFWDSLDTPAIKPGDKYVEVDTNLLQRLRASLDNNPAGHISVSPSSLDELVEWASTRNTGTVHSLTQELLNAITDLGKKPK